MKEFELLPVRLSSGTKPTRAITYRVNKKGCWLCTSHKPSAQGYPRVRIDKQLIQLHRFVYTTFVGPIPDGYCVMHLCDNKRCVNPKHLQPGTLAENTIDGWKHNLYPQNINKRRGEDVYNSKLTESQVRQIRLRAVESDRKLAKEFGVSPATIDRVRNRTVWRHVK